MAAVHTGSYTIRPHSHTWHQLIYAAQGVMSVHTAQGEWVVPPHRAVWAPAGVEHSLAMVGSVSLQTLYVATSVSHLLPASCSVVNVSPLLRELILHIIRIGMLDRRVPEHAHLIDFLLDQLPVLPATPLQLPLPRDPRARHVADRLRARPDDPGSVHQLAGAAGASGRTIERIFVTETGMTFGRWRQQARLLHAIRLLAAGNPVTEVALDVGYESVSAFIAVFKSTFGTTPNRYFESQAS